MCSSQYQRQLSLSKPDPSSPISIRPAIGRMSLILVFDWGEEPYLLVQERLADGPRDGARGWRRNRGVCHGELFVDEEELLSSLSALVTN